MSASSTGATCAAVGVRHAERVAKVNNDLRAELAEHTALFDLRHEADQLSEAYLRLYTFAGDHPEAQEIFMAID